MNKPILIYADFMKIDDENRLILVCHGTYKDLEKNNVTLKNGMKIIFYSDDADDKGNRDDLVVEGFAEYDKEKQRWTAKIIWEDIKNISQLPAEEKKNLGFGEN